MKQISINILGHIYNVLLIKEDEITDDLKVKHETMNGICENFSQELIIFQDEPKPENYRRIDLLERKVARHELFHAYLHKSGISQLISKDTEEAIVDMLAINFDKIVYNVELIDKLFKEKEVKNETTYDKR